MKKHTLQFDSSQSEVEVKNWTFSQEREFIETLANTRLNFLLVIFSLVLAAIAAVNNIVFQRVVFIIGFLICFPLSLSVIKAGIKSDILVDALRNMPNHPVKVVDDFCRKNRLVKFSVRSFLHYYIPTICSLLMLVGFVLSFIPCTRAIFLH